MQHTRPRAGWLLTLIATICAPAAFAHDTPKPIALVNGRILTVDGGGGTVIDQGIVLIKDGKIAGVGTDVKIPEGTETIDVSGMTVCPGLIDVRSRLWIDPGSASSSSSSGTVNLAEVIDTYAEDWQEVAKQGVTVVSVQPRGSMGGRCVVLRVAGGHDEEHLTIDGAAGIQASLGIGARNATTRYSQYTGLKKQLEAVKKYQDEWKKYREALKKWEEEQKKKKKDGKGKKDDKAKKPEEKPKEEKKPATKKVKVLNFRGRKIPLERVPPQVVEQMKARGATIEEIDVPVAGASTAKKTSGPAKDKDGKPKEPKKDKVKEVLVKLLERKIPLRVEVNTADDAANAIKLGEEMNVDIVLEGVAKLGRSWKKVNAARPPLVVGPIAALEGTVSGRRTDWFSDVVASENLVAISTFTGSARGSRLLRAHAAAAVAQGMSTDRALESVTINAAKVLGLGDKLGSIKVGKLGDVAVFTGHPTDPAAAVMLTVSQGQVTYKATDKPHAVASQRSEVSGLPEVLPEAYSIKSTRVLKADGTYAPATIKVAGGKIVSVGNETPDNAFDVGDAVITPGLVVGHANSSTTTSIDPVSAHTHAADDYNPESEGFAKMRKGGFTAVAYAPSSSNVVAGQMACVRFEAQQPVAMKDGWPHTIAGKFVLSGASRSSSRYPSALTGQVDLLTRYFEGEDFDTRLYVPGSIEAAMDKKAAAHLASLKAGETIAVFEANTADEVRAALDLIEQFKLKGVLLHPRDLRGQVGRIKELGVGVVASAMTANDYDWYANDLATASKAGVPIAFSGTTPASLRITAAMLVNAGMAPEAAMKALTSDAARMCGLTDCGEIASNKPADLVIWTGSPVDFGARPVQVIVDGQVVKEEL